MRLSAAVVRGLVSQWPEDRRVRWAERAAIKWIQGNIDREEAEIQAYEEERGMR